MGHEGPNKILWMGEKSTWSFAWHMWVFVSWSVGYCVKPGKERGRSNVKLWVVAIKLYIGIGSCNSFYCHGGDLNMNICRGPST